MDPQLSAVGIILYVEPEKVNDAVAFYKAAFDAVEANDPYFAAQVIIGGTVYLIEYHEDPSDLWVWFSCFKFSLYFVSLSFGGLLEEKWLKLDLIMFFLSVYLIWGLFVLVVFYLFGFYGTFYTELVFGYILIIINTWKYVFIVTI